MAEIGIQKKKGSIWPWIIGLIVAALLIWALTEMLDTGDDVVVTEPGVVEPYDEAVISPADTMDALAVGAAEVAQFEEQCGAQSATRSSMALDHASTENCVRLMTTAMEAVVSRDTVNDTALGAQLEAFRTKADRLTRNRESTEHSAYLKEVMTGAADLIAQVEQTHAGSDAAAGNVRQAAESFSASQPMMSQTTQVATFFDSATSALRELAMR